MSGRNSSNVISLLVSAVVILGVGFAFVPVARCGELILPSTVLDRDATVHAVYRASWPATGKGSLSIRWTDVLGRVVDERTIRFVLSDETDVGFDLDVRRAVSMKNELTVHFSLDGTNHKGEPDRREEDSRLSFVARYPYSTWWDYELIMWQEHSLEENAALRALGISAGAHGSKSERTGSLNQLPVPLLDNDLRWYEENVATDFYSEYHRWFPDRDTNWKFRELKEFFKKDLTSREALKRHPSLSDPAWIKKIQDRLTADVRRMSPYRPLFYNLGDEPGIADLAAHWDFDFSDFSLNEMRVWLKEEYGTLSALNDQWGTSFTSWDSVMPMTTSDALKRADDNYSAWGDFKEWMDIAFSRAVKAGVDAVRSVDPEAYVALEGGQVPGWGGFDYARLSKILSAIEPYDSGANMEAIHSFNPNIVTLITSGGNGVKEKRRMWYEVLHGNRGIILWDPKSEVVTKEARTGTKGQELGPLFQELRSGLGALLINSDRQAGPIAIHYSQATFRIRWLLEQKTKGDAWIDRTSAMEDDSNYHQLQQSYCRAIEDLGLQYRFVSYEQVEQDELLRGGYRVMILPDSVALSRVEVEALRRFVEQGGTLIADGDPGIFDNHLRRLAKPQLADLFDGPRDKMTTERTVGLGQAIHLNFDMQRYIRDRLLGQERAVLGEFRRLFQSAGVKAGNLVTDASGEPAAGVELHTFRNGSLQILGLHANPQMYVEDLGPADAISNARFEKLRNLILTLQDEFYVHDIRAGKSLGKKKQISVSLDPFEPALFAVSPVPFPSVMVSAPARLRRGETGQLGISFSGATPARVHVFHVEITNPAGKRVGYYSGNLLAPTGHASKLLPMAVNDQTGNWTVTVKDVLTGQSRTVTVEVF